MITFTAIHNVILIPAGVDKEDAEHTVEVWPGYWINPRACAVLKDVRLSSDALPLVRVGEPSLARPNDADAHLGATERV